MDFGAKIDGYCADMTRTVVIGNADEEMKRLYATVLSAQEAALSEIHEGMRCRDADEIAAAEEMTPELGIRMMGDLSASLAEAYDAVAACADEGMRGEVSKLNLVDFVDPSVAEPLIAVQSKLEEAE
jgi:methionine aminopeptidase